MILFQWTQITVLQEEKNEWKYEKVVDYRDSLL